MAARWRRTSGTELLSYYAVRNLGRLLAMSSDLMPRTTAAPLPPQIMLLLRSAPYPGIAMCFHGEHSQDLQ